MTKRVERLIHTRRARGARDLRVPYNEPASPPHSAHRLSTGAHADTRPGHFDRDRIHAPHHVLERESQTKRRVGADRVHHLRPTPSTPRKPRVGSRRTDQSHPNRCSALFLSAHARGAHNIALATIAGRRRSVRSSRWSNAPSGGGPSSSACCARGTGAGRGTACTACTAADWTRETCRCPRTFRSGA